MSYKRSRADFEADRPSPAQAPYAIYGTPLPPLDSQSRDDGSYVPVWQQDVRDERGRKRLHGAFTGGFSAGYFNTVGSKEGWTPATFVSSRAKRVKDQQAKKAEDFMDDEDLADAAEAQKLETQGTFAGLGTTQDDGSRKGHLGDLLRSSGDSMGVKLLQRMGWRAGQGVGPKVRRRADGDENGALHLFAPENTRMITFNRKTDRFGLGYASEERLGGQPKPRKPTTMQYDQDDEDDEHGSALSFARPQTSKPKPKKSGFGVGILNDTGSDDEDPYEMGPKISYNRVIGGDKKKKKKGGLVSSTAANPALKGLAAPTFVKRQGRIAGGITTGFRKCHDGRLPLDGFVLSVSPLLTDQANKFPPPNVPPDWEPSRLKDPSIDENNGTAQFESTADAARASTLDPAKRAAVLGEEQLKGKSIFDYISASSREKLVAVTGRADLPQARGEAAPEGFEQTAQQKQRSMWDLVPQLDSSVASAALARGTTGWMPYSEDLDKRARYRSFLELHAGKHSELPGRKKGCSVEEWATEMREFAQAAQVFKPISGLMASRFTSSSSGPKLAKDSADVEPKGATKTEDPAEQAAKLGMFGPMTRSTMPFYPSRLVCKRFGVPAPAGADPGSAPDEGEATRDSRLDVVSKASMDEMMREASRTGMGASSNVQEAETVSQVPSREAEVVDAEVNAALEGKRAGEDVFRAIFGDDSDEE